MGQLHHCDYGASSNQRAGWPEQGVEDSDSAVKLGQDGTLSLVGWVHKAVKCVLRPEALTNALNNGARRRVVLVTLWDVETLRKRRKSNNSEESLDL